LAGVLANPNATPPGNETFRIRENESDAIDFEYGEDSSIGSGTRFSTRGGQVIGTITGAIVVGLVVGGLARLIMPGKQNIGVVMTVILGAIGAFLGTWVSYKLGYSNQNGGFKIIPFLVGIVFACILIAIYLGVTGRRITNRVGRR
jgi:uncharacterized membrane protein YeaQ/YmgE (transglycosylase-associated protein family)